MSARLDGEQEPVAPSVVDAHLADCAACRRWFDDAAQVTRLLRTGPATGGVDVTDVVLAAAPGRWRFRVEALLRVALGVLGAGQIVLGLLQLTALRPAAEVHVHGMTPDGAGVGHLWHESAAWNVAIGAAFLWVASRRTRPAGLVPILTAFIGLLAVLSVLDVVAGQVSATRLGGHTMVVVGYVVVLALSRPSLELAPPGLPTAALHPEEAVPEPDLGTDPDRWGDSVIPLPARGHDQPAARRDDATIRGDRAA